MAGTSREKRAVATLSDGEAEMPRAQCGPPGKEASWDYLQRDAVLPAEVRTVALGKGVGIVTLWIFTGPEGPSLDPNCK